MSKETKLTKCRSCKEFFEFEPDETKFDERGYGYSTKYVLCKSCGKIVILGHKEDKGLNVNFDARFYF